MLFRSHSYRPRPGLFIRHWHRWGTEGGIGHVANLTDIINNTYTVVDKDKKQIPTQDIVITRRITMLTIVVVSFLSQKEIKVHLYLD